MMDADRVGVRAYAWSEADRAAILRHLIDLMFALDIALHHLRNSAYAGHMKYRLDEWQAILEAVPPDKPTT
jgi:hypothetical protein